LAALAGGLVDSFFVAAALFVGAFLAAVLALEVGEVPVTDLFEAPRLVGVVVFLVAVVAALGFALVTLATGLVTFLAGAFFTVEGFGFSASAFFGGALLVVADLGLVAVDDLGLVVALVVLSFDTDLVAALGFETVFDVGLFSLAAASVGLDLGANLTLRENPLGRTKMLFSSPEAMALDN